MEADSLGTGLAESLAEPNGYEAIDRRQFTQLQKPFEKDAIGILQETLLNSKI